MLNLPLKLEQLLEFEGHHSRKCALEIREPFDLSSVHHVVCIWNQFFARMNSDHLFVRHFPFHLRGPSLSHITGQGLVAPIG